MTSSFHAPTRAAEVAYAALREIGRDDLAQGLLWYEDDDGPYAEFDDCVLDKADWALIDRAETLGRAAIGLPSRLRWETANA